MQKVLFIGEHPMGNTGNSSMMRAVLSQLDCSKYSPLCLCQETQDLNFLAVKEKFPLNIIASDIFGDPNKVANLIQNSGTRIVVFVGIDLWRFGGVFQLFPQFKALDPKFKFIGISPYEFLSPRADFVEWLNHFDFPCVYSQYSYDLLHDHVENLQYFRPPLWNSTKYRKYTPEERIKVRKRFFPSVTEEDFIFGFVGTNSIRKDPQRFLKAYVDVRNQIKEKGLPFQTKVYMHTNLVGVYNLQDFGEQIGLQTGEMLLKPQNQSFSDSMMVDLYNALDCLVNTSVQEGLSWTLLNAMLSGCPVIASDTSAQKELMDGVGFLCPPTETAYIPILTKRGPSFIEGKIPSVYSFSHAMKVILSNKELREKMIKKGLEKGKDWLEGVSNINALLDMEKKAIPAKVRKKEKAVLFAQHSAAGDVFMTTRCFEGIVKRYKMPLHYMTSPQYKNVIEDNKYVEKVLDWDPEKAHDYEIVLNPHGDKILPGHWGRNSNSLLSDFYWQILRVDPNPFMIKEKEPPLEIVTRIRRTMPLTLLVHTTGGDPDFRTYKFMKEVCEWAKDEGMRTVQLGGKRDYPAGANVDLRGKLTYQESAWVIRNLTDYAVTVDSFMSHLCGAYGVSQVCLFGSGNFHVVRPNQVSGKLICLVPNYVKYCPGLGPCSASKRDCSTPSCTGLHDPYDIIKGINRIIFSDDDNWEWWVEGEKQ